MPIPEPRPGETERDYMGRCVPMQLEEGKPQDQAAAVCFTTFRRARGLREDADELPTLDVGGAGYALKLKAEGHRAALVVTDPEPYAGRRFRFPEGDGFRQVRLGEASGPFFNLMSLPAPVLHGLDASRLRELGESRQLYLVEVHEAADLREDGEDELDAMSLEGGMHWHPLTAERASAAGEQSWHRHLFRVEAELDLGEGVVLPAGSLIVTELDGGHEHDVGEDGGDTADEAGHTHELLILLPSGEVVRHVTGPGEAHKHQAGVARTGFDGLHGHELALAGRTMKSLTPPEIAEHAPAPPAPEGEGGEETSPEG